MLGFVASFAITNFGPLSHSLSALNNFNALHILTSTFYFQETFDDFLSFRYLFRTTTVGQYHELIS